MNVLNQKVIRLNRVWQVIGESTVEEALKMMCTDVATAIFCDKETMRPVNWAEWITLPVVEEDGAIHTPRMAIRRPTVIICQGFSKLIKRRPKLGLKGILIRDGRKCQYTGKVLTPENATLDHVVPRGRGGEHTWRNVVAADKEFNNKKGDRLNEEIGAKLLRAPREPLPAPPSAFIVPTHPDHERFL